MPKFNVSPGLNHVGAYQVSGKPFASGSITTALNTPRCIKFPYLTRWVWVSNHGTDQVLRVGFSEGGVKSADAVHATYDDPGDPEPGNYFFRIPPKKTTDPGAQLQGDTTTVDDVKLRTTTDQSMMMSSVRLEIKVSEIWIVGSSNVDVVAGLTNIPVTAVANENGRNWTGSIGVG